MAGEPVDDYYAVDNGQEYVIGGRYDRVTLGGPQGPDYALIENPLNGKLRVLGYERMERDGTKVIRIRLETAT